ncbi:TLC domain containing protein, putative [Angomonas deanei]|uniref:TLC domain containing protein, putative n=1 Tax=Angomonas deanei TaxID=59799 RepID=A0A7G2C4T6_9TRYP|nr:TLC domain containing protein, putative [Angomonas deanei]
MTDLLHFFFYQPISADPKYAAEFGISSPFTVEQIMQEVHANPAAITKYRISSVGELLHAFKNICAFQNESAQGCSGFGFQWNLTTTLAPIVTYVIILMMIRYAMQEPLARFGIYMGVVTENKKKHAEREARGLYGSLALSRRNQKKILKFQNQLWLCIFYILSTYFGYYVQKDKPWFTLPLNTESALHLLLPHPWTPPQEMVVYYYYGLAFYLSELFSLIFIEHRIKRSDFIEYCVHHVTTLLLMICSYIGWEHRFGAYVLFIHDASDIMLSLAKCTHYMIEENEFRETLFNKHSLQRYHAKQKRGASPSRKAHANNDKKDDDTVLRYKSSFLFQYILVENTANVMFAIFIVVFFFFRLYCLPLMAHSTILFASKVRHGNFNMWMLVALLNGCLQLLHVYWAVLIVRMVISVFVDNQRKDIRSDDDDDTNEQPDGTDHPWVEPEVVPARVLEDLLHAKEETSPEKKKK